MVIDPVRVALPDFHPGSGRGPPGPVEKPAEDVQDLAFRPGGAAPHPDQVGVGIEGQLPGVEGPGVW